MVAFSLFFVISSFSRFPLSRLEVSPIELELMKLLSLEREGRREGGLNEILTTFHVLSEFLFLSIHFSFLTIGFLITIISTKTHLVYCSMF